MSVVVGVGLPEIRKMPEKIKALQNQPALLTFELVDYLSVALF